VAQYLAPAATSAADVGFTAAWRSYLRRDRRSPAIDKLFHTLATLKMSWQSVDGSEVCSVLGQN
jgi:hypothetical protein